MASLLTFRQHMDHVCSPAVAYEKTTRRGLNSSWLYILLVLICCGINTKAAVLNNDTFDGMCDASTLNKSEIGRAEILPVVTDPNITVRLNNPTYNCNTQKYIVDVEFQSDLPNERLFGMNVRFWYDDSVLELDSLKGFSAGYGAVSPSPPTKQTLPTQGPTWFNFAGAAEFVNGAIQLTNVNATPIYISTSGWTKLFQITFAVDDPNANYSNFWPSVVLDLEQNPANGGYLPGSDGIVMTVYNGGSFPVSEHVNQYNWQYIGSGTSPYGQPASTNPASISCIPVVSCPPNITIACGASTLPSNTGTATATDFCAGDPLVSYNDVIAGTPCPGGSNLITRTWLASDNCGNTGNCEQYISVGGTYCNKLVSNQNDSGIGSLRDCISCATAGDTIKFHSILAGKTISITSTKIILNKNLFIRSTITPRIGIKSQIPGLFDVTAGNTIEIKDLDITSGLSTTNNDGAAFNNLGILKFIGVKVFRNSNLATGQYLIRDKPSSQLNLNGSCFIQYN